MKGEELTNEDVADVLSQARKLMNDKGAHWTQGTLRHTDRRTKEVSYCSLGAIHQVTVGREKLRKAAIQELVESLTADALWDAQSEIIRWNDQSSRTWGDVSSAFQNAIRKLRRRKTRSRHLPAARKTKENT